MSQAENLQAAAAAIRAADALLIGAGAGLGVDSGLPDFRGNDGFWKAYPPLKKLGLSFAKLANPYWFRSDPELAWGFYGHRRNLYRRTQPHQGYSLLKKWAARMPAGCFVFTSNVDGHFSRAGFPADHIVECHGTLEFLQCAVPCHGEIWPANNESIAMDHATLRAQPPLPICQRCGALARPNVLMFNDGDWIESRAQAQYDHYQAWRRKIRASKLVVVELGAGTAIPTVRLECESTGGTLIRINPREPQTSPGHVSLDMGALAALTALDEVLQ